MVSTARLPSLLLPRLLLPSSAHVSEVCFRKEREKRRCWFGPQRLKRDRSKQDGKIERFDVSTLTAARLSSLYVTGCCGMNHAAFLWMLCKQFIVTVQVWVTIPVKESPQTYCYASERFYHCYAIQRSLPSIKDYSNSFFWYFPCFVEQGSNKLAPGCRAKFVA